MTGKTLGATRRKPEQYFSIATVAEQLEVSTRTIRRWIAAGDLAVHHVGRQIRISETDLSIFLALRRDGNTGDR